MKQKAFKTARNIALAILALLVVMIGGGLAYAWYAGQHADENSQAFQTPGQTFKQAKVAPGKVNQAGPIGASIQTLSSPVTPGSNASVMVRTNPQATCVITVEYANKTQSKDSGLTQKKSDEYGIVQWAWTVEPTVPEGVSPVTVTCANQKNSAMVRGDLKVAKTAE